MPAREPGTRRWRQRCSVFRYNTITLNSRVDGSNCASMESMKIASITRLHRHQAGFTLAEVSLAMGVVAMFGLAAFSTNQRLLFALKSQKETVAATTAMQWRMETLRATSFTNVANKDYVKNNILTTRTAQITIPQRATITVDPFATLGSITEQITVGAYPPNGSTNTVVSWDANHASGQDISTGTFNITDSANPNYTRMLRVDVLETWTGSNGRQRQRQLSTICTPGDSGQ